MYKKEGINRQGVSSCVYDSKEDAIQYAYGNRVATIEIEWEE